MTDRMKISCRDATINALKEEIAGLNKHRYFITEENKRLRKKLEHIYECRYEFDELFRLASRAWDKGGEND